MVFQTYFLHQKESSSFAKFGFPNQISKTFQILRAIWKAKVEVHLTHLRHQRSWGSYAWLRSFSPRSWYCLLRSRSSWIVKQWKPQVHSSLGSKFTKYQHVLPRSLTQSLKNAGWEMSFLLGSCTFRGDVKLQEGNHVQPPTRNDKKNVIKKRHPNLYLRNSNLMSIHHGTSVHRFNLRA